MDELIKLAAFADKKEKRETWHNSFVAFSSYVPFEVDWTLICPYITLDLNWK